MNADARGFDSVVIPAKAGTIINSKLELHPVTVNSHRVSVSIICGNANLNHDIVPLNRVITCLQRHITSLNRVNVSLHCPDGSLIRLE